MTEAARTSYAQRLDRGISELSALWSVIFSTRSNTTQCNFAQRAAAKARRRAGPTRRNPISEGSALAHRRGHVPSAP
jgi:hypothetical protein